MKPLPILWRSRWNSNITDSHCAIHLAPRYLCAYVIDLKPCLTVQSIQCYKKQRTHGKETLLICNYVEFDFRLKNKKSTYRSPKAEYILGTYILKQNQRWWGVGRGRTTKQVFWFQTEKANAKLLSVILAQKQLHCSKKLLRWNTSRRTAISQTYVTHMHIYLLCLMTSSKSHFLCACIWSPENFSTLLGMLQKLLIKKLFQVL
jgi:hypothetical protein